MTARVPVSELGMHGPPGEPTEARSYLPAESPAAAGRPDGPGVSRDAASSFALDSGPAGFRQDSPAGGRPGRDDRNPPLPERRHPGGRWPAESPAELLKQDGLGRSRATAVPIVPVPAGPPVAAIRRSAYLQAGSTSVGLGAPARRGAS
jgi:hypothetical protein